MDEYNIPFAAYSALFRAVNNSMFINDKLSNRIVSAGLSILNPSSKEVYIL